MRISLLETREPFASILEQTLADFWSTQHGRPFTVSWQEGRPQADDDQGQLWLANRYLNIIFRPGVRDDLLTQTRREFGRSPVWWRSPLQAVYVHGATGRWSERLAQAHMRVAPPLPDAEMWLVIPGNHKIRLLDGRSGTAYGVLKAGFKPEFMLGEIAARTAAEWAGVAVPPLLACAPDRTWFAEKLVDGTPLNRLGDTAEASAAVRAAAADLAAYLRLSRCEANEMSYAQEVQAAAGSLLAQNRLLDGQVRDKALRAAAALTARLAARGPARVLLAQGHGDFQPANILRGEKQVWLIDWEYAAERQVLFDALLYCCAARAPQGLAQRLRLFVQNGWPAALPLRDVDWPGMAALDGVARARAADLFLLEELLLQLRENSQPPLLRSGRSLPILLAEIGQWLAGVAPHG